jgi:hypothetical protein
LLFSLVFFDGIHNYRSHSEIAQPTVNPGNIQILQGRAVILEETNYLAIGLWKRRKKAMMQQRMRSAALKRDFIAASTKVTNEMCRLRTAAKQQWHRTKTAYFFLAVNATRFSFCHENGNFKQVYSEPSNN